MPALLQVLSDVVVPALLGLGIAGTILVAVWATRSVPYIPNNRAGMQVRGSHGPSPLRCWPRPPRRRHGQRVRVTRLQCRVTRLQCRRHDARVGRQGATEVT